MVLQARSPTVPTQAPAPYTPAQTNGGFDMNSIMNMMMMMMIVVMMVKMMRGATQEMS